MRDKLDGKEGFQEATTELDVVKLLKLIKKNSYQHQSWRYPYRAICLTMCILYMTNQKESMTLERYFDEFLNCHNMLEQCGGCTASHP
eukprot:2487465-Ditylum_brightwellii.AAC.1